MEKNIIILIVLSPHFAMYRENFQNIKKIDRSEIIMI